MCWFPVIKRFIAVVDVVESGWNETSRCKEEKDDQTWLGKSDATVPNWWHFRRFFCCQLFIRMFPSFWCHWTAFESWVKYFTQRKNAFVKTIRSRFLNQQFSQQKIDASFHVEIDSIYKQSCQLWNSTRYPHLTFPRPGIVLKSTAFPTTIMNYLACLSRCFGLAAGNVKVSQFEQALNEIQLDTSTMGLSSAHLGL